MSEKELNSIICKKINYYMDINGTTQMELANYMGVSQATISNWQKGIKTPRMSKIDKICEFFHIQRSDLMEDKEVSTEDKSSFPEVNTLAAHFEGEEFSEAEMEEIKNFVEFVKNKRK
ncbi:helix-turn-helix domain-containing protein [Eubacterium ventriosum]|jgi:transcriptional regulator with XRE-family HTH domain|uniref:helix-turn-helix domain-containing protein n=1 Tax=Eubacterium ventriosum TaxID=39496 RepID=UPI000E4E831D|nr:helix-turn-helix transcriptional regulator [Eubacterium ventriosum]RHB18560.1 XRE family transcriptional regulator [Eubacterium ventriosum]DAT90035.1 MAG TPA: Repressor protein CI [Bacteriophage sp.]